MLRFFLQQQQQQVFLYYITAIVVRRRTSSRQNPPLVSSCYYLYSTSKWKTGRVALETSVIEIQVRYRHAKQKSSFKKQ